LLDKLGATFDRIVIDSAPVNLVSDTVVFSRIVQGVCLVVRAGKTPRRSVQRAVQSLQQAEARLFGVVLNGVSLSRLDRKHRRYYSKAATS
jgi:polysaccharide biosynthesis transport protein